jgi:hypothetical protein
MIGRRVLAGVIALAVGTFVSSAGAEALDGYMTGGGSIIGVPIGGGGEIVEEEAVAVYHGFELYCDPTNMPNNLQVSWEGNTAHLDTVGTAMCIFDPNLSPENPEADFNTLTVSGVGHLESSGRTVNITAVLTDAGEGGQQDSATFVITDPIGGAPLLAVTGRLKGGNHQAHGFGLR